MKVVIAEVFLQFVVVFIVFVKGNVKEENAGLFEGDMILSKEQEDALEGRNFGYAAASTKMLWPTTIAYNYSIDIANEPRAVAAIQGAIKEYESKTCLRFIRRTNEKSYMNFINGGACFAFVGRCFARCPISLGSGCWSSGIVVHEIGHSLGFYHEQNRPDRDSYVRIIRGNIKKGMEYQFKKLKFYMVNSMNTPYDFASVMHYSRTAFGSGKVTIDAIDSKNNYKIGQRTGLSKLDSLQLNRRYGCPGFAALEPTTVTAATASM